MEILRVKTDGYGRLAGTFDLEDGLNVVVGPNQSGKSTFVSLILSLLYGLDRTRPFAPWDGGAFAGEIDVALGNGKQYRISRDFGNEVTRVTDLNDGRDVTPEFLIAAGTGGVEIGARFLALSRAAFLGSAVIRQGAHLPGEAGERDGVLRAIRSLVDTAGVVEETAETALARLRGALEAFPGRLLGVGPVAQEVGVIESRIREIGAKLDSLVSKRKEMRGLMIQLSEIGRTLPVLERSQKAAELRTLLVRQKALTAARARLESAVQERDRLRDEVTDLAGTEGFSPEKLAELERQVEIFGAARDQAEKLTDEVRSVNEEMDGLDRERIAANSSLAEMSVEWREKAVRRIGELGTLRGRRESLAGKQREKETALASRGSDVAAFEKLRFFFRNLSDDQLQFLRRDAEEEARVEEDEEALRAEEREYRRTVAEVKADRSATGRTGRLLTYLGFSLTAVGILALVMSPALGDLVRGANRGVFLGMGLAFLVVAVLVLGIGVWNLVTARNKGGRDLDEANEGIAGVKRRRTDAAKRRTDRQNAMAGLAVNLDVDGGVRALRERYLLYMAQKEVFEEFLKSQEALEEQDLEISALEREIESMLLGCGILVHGDELSGEAMDRFTREVAVLSRIEERLSDLKAKRESLTKDLRDAEITRDEALQKIEELLKAVGRGEGQTGNGISERMEAFRRSVEGALRRQSLLSRDVPQAEARVEETLRDLEPVLGSRGPDEAQASLREKIRACSEAIVSLRSMEVASDDPLPDDAMDHEGEARRLAENRIELEREQSHVRESVRALFADLDSAPDLAAEREEWEREKAEIESFRQAVDLARTRVDSIARTTHARWARKVNQTAGKILSRLSDSLGEMHFNDDLSFSLMSRARGEPLSEAELRAALSQGAKDLIYIAFRLSLCRFLSGPGETLPLILDDALVSLDDPTHSRAMDLLLEGADGWGHQVILLTCHEGRYRTWRAEAKPGAPVNEILLRP